MQEYKAPILIAYLKGKTIEYYDELEKQWLAVYRYEHPEDIQRLSNKLFKFRIKE